MKKDNIFDRLRKKKIPFSVCVGENTFRGMEVYGRGQDYFIITSSRYVDVKALMSDEFRKNKVYPDIYERDLSVDEVSVFRVERDMYSMVRSNRDGKVYEIKGVSLREKRANSLCSPAKKHHNGRIRKV